MFPVAASLAQLLGTPLKQSTLNHSAAEFETSNTTHTTKVESSRFSFTIFYAHAKSKTHANSGSPPSPPPLSPPWQLCQSWHCLGCLGVHLVSFAVRLLRVCIMISTFSRQPYQREAATAPLYPPLTLPLLSPVGVIEIIFQQLYQRGSTNDKYSCINKLQATHDSCRVVSPQLGSIFFTFHLAL